MSQRQGKLFNCTNRDLPLSARAVPGQVGRLVFISLHRRVVTWHRVTNQDTHSFIDAGASAVGCSAFPYMSNYASMQCFPANRVILDGSKSISGLFFWDRHMVVWCRLQMKRTVILFRFMQWKSRSRPHSRYWSVVLSSSHVHPIDEHEGFGWRLKMIGMTQQTLEITEQNLKIDWQNLKNAWQNHRWVTLACMMKSQKWLTKF
jgi:hypothetical protein